VGSCSSLTFPKQYFSLEQNVEGEMIKIKWTDIMNEHIPTDIACGADESVQLPLHDLQLAFKEKLQDMEAADSWLQNMRKRKTPPAEALEMEALANQGSAGRPVKWLRSVHHVYHCANI
jgi:hypothetical protein